MNKYMKLAIKEAQKGITLGHGGPFGAVVVKDGKVIAKGHNRVVGDNDPTCHGEVDDSVLIFSCDVATKIVINKHSLTSLSIFFLILFDLQCLYC